MKKTKVKKKKKHKESKDKEEEQMKSMADSALRALGITPKTPSSKAKGEDYQSKLSSSMSNFPSGILFVVTSVFVSIVFSLFFFSVFNPRPVPFDLIFTLK